MCVYTVVVFDCMFYNHYSVATDVVLAVLRVAVRTSGPPLLAGFCFVL